MELVGQKVSDRNGQRLPQKLLFCLCSRKTKHSVTSLNSFSISMDLPNSLCLSEWTQTIGVEEGGWTLEWMVWLHRNSLVDSYVGFSWSWTLKEGKVPPKLIYGDSLFLISEISQNPVGPRICYQDWGLWTIHLSALTVSLLVPFVFFVWEVVPP